MTQRRLPLRVTLPLTLILSAVVSGFASYAYNQYATGQDIEREAEAKAKELQRVRNNIEFEYQEGDEARIRYLVSELSADTSIIEAFLLDHNGKILAATDLSLSGESKSFSDFSRRRQHPLEPIVDIDSKIVNVSYPVLFAVTANEIRAQQIGYFNVRIDMTRRIAELSYTNRMQQLFYAILLFGLAFAMWFYFDRVVGKRVSILNGAVRRFGAGNLGSRVNLRTGDEFGELGDAFDRMAEQIENQQENLHALQMALDQHAIVSITDVGGRITYVNEQFCKASGYSHQELIGKNHRIIKSDAHDAAFYLNLWQTIANGDVWKGLIQNKRKDGKPYWVQSTIVPILDEKKKPAKYISVRTEVTQRERMRRAMEMLAIATAGHGSFDAIAAALCEGLDSRWAGFGVLVDNERSIQLLGLWNDGVSGDKIRYDILGTPCGDVCGNGRSLTVSDRAFEQYPTDPLLAKTKANSYRGEPLIAEDGKVFGVIWAADTNARLDDESERALLRLAAKRAVLELNRSQYEKALRDNEIQLAEAQRMAQLGSWTLDLTTNKLAWSDEVYRIFELDKKQHQKSYQAFLDAIHPDDRQLVDTAYQQSVSQKLPYSIVHRLQMRDGRIKWVNERGETSYDVNGQPVRTIGYVHDITNIKEAELEREKLQSQLQQAQKMEIIGQLTGGIAHDFNNLLAAIIGFTELSIYRFVNDPNSKLAEYLQHVLQAGHRGRNLVQQMLAFGRIQPDAQQLVDATSEIQKVVQLLGSTLPSSIRLTVSEQKPLPPITISTVQLHQVISNLVINARDAMNGSGQIQIELFEPTTTDHCCSSCHKPFQGNYVEISVKDDGSGVPTESLPRIFEPFFTTKQIGKGSGMGLSMVHGIVHQNGGHVVVENITGKGCNFRLFFPTRNIEQPTRQESAQRIPATNVAGKTIMVVDDEIGVGNFVAELLKNHGYVVEAFANSENAWSRFNEDPNRFDLVITDNTMPKITGPELAKRMLALKPKLPVILCSGYRDEKIDEQAETSGITVFIQKPFTTTELLDTIGRLLDQSTTILKRA